MRADRLLSLLMLLQSRGRLTAYELAAELEVSPRTVYRDLDALSGIGVPVYAERGPGGGCALLEGYRTTLTGLTEDEVCALFMFSLPLLDSPGPLAQLGLGPELKAALLKLAAALPAARRGDDQRVRQRIHLDPVAWTQGEEAVPHLQTLHQAVWEDRRACLNYRLPFGTPVERSVEPYGLVAKAGAWYLVYFVEDRPGVQRVAQLLDVRLEEPRFSRLAGFDLAAYWSAWCAARANDPAAFPVRARLAPALVGALPAYFGARAAEILARAGPPTADGWMTVELAFDSFYQARERLLGLGGAVEVLEPLALRLSLADFAAQIAGVYTRHDPPSAAI
jgi:predicted DNA-binding transcriptional regulator YafY